MTVLVAAVGIYTVLHSSQISYVIIFAQETNIASADVLWTFHLSEIHQLNNCFCVDKLLFVVLSSMFKSLRLTLPASGNLNSM